MDNFSGNIFAFLLVVLNSLIVNGIYERDQVL